MFLPLAFVVCLSAVPSWSWTRDGFIFERRIGGFILDRRSHCTTSKLQVASTCVREEEPPVDADCTCLTIQRLTRAALTCRGQPRGLVALKELAELSSRRSPFDFDATMTAVTGQNETCIVRLPGLLPETVTREVRSQVQSMQYRGWLSTNPDSVDGLPSLHINLVSNGRPLDCGDDDFGRSLRHLVDVVTPYIYQDLLPRVRMLVRSSSVQVGDVFIRRYGPDVLDGTSRKGMSAHYDVYSVATAVIALDNVGAQGMNGLYTTDRASSQVTYHAALRRFFPLSSGDAVVHTWDVLHGVDIEPGLDRASLVVWFTMDEKGALQSRFVPPWLVSRQGDAVGQYVLATALESSETECFDVEGSPLDLYLRSAVSGNTFALTRLGALCEQRKLSANYLEQAEYVLHRLQTDHATTTFIENESLPPSSNTARKFWLEAAFRGNQFAQTALAEEIMAFEGTTKGASSCEAQEWRLLAAVLFGLAAEQGNDEAVDAIERVVALEIASNQIRTEEEFMKSPVVTAAQTALSCLGS